MIRKFTGGFYVLQNRSLKFFFVLGFMDDLRQLCAAIGIEL